MYIKSLHLKNVRCFEDLRLNFTDDSGRVRRWTCLLGNNAVGKTVILSCIAMALGGGPTANELVLDPKSWIRRGRNKGLIEVTISSGKEDIFGGDLNIRYWLIGDGSVRVNGNYFEGPSVVPDPNIEDYRVFTDAVWTKIGCFSCGYGPMRRVPSELELQRKETRTFKHPRSANFVTMFDESALLGELEQWLADLEFVKYKQKDYQSYVMFSRARRALNKLLGDAEVKFVEITSDKKALFKTPDGKVTLAHLSSGYQGIISWAGDLLVRLGQNFTELPNPLTGEGVVLVDEIDAHLHPKMQRDIVDFVRDRFPRLQFIVSSHSPFVAQALDAGEIIVMERVNRKTILARPIKETFKGWTPDKIFSSKLFGLDRIVDRDTEIYIDRYRDLASRKTLTTKEKKELEDLRNAMGYILPEVGSTEEERTRVKEIRNLVETTHKLLQKYSNMEEKTGSGKQSVRRRGSR
jgi:hypothetical protein